ncbi:odorant receptor 131-2-like [Boleophthalmus pectinirostris]|uniref:odorant receptor 131-2-like n=1 Tax=Boleophthalmus pectinirostris TaxID=150288 RepID=UPI00242B1E8C|nr:odorant receptor 131-2-like [Boleophthalmus pectinirostris]
MNTTFEGKQRDSFTKALIKNCIIIFICIAINFINGILIHTFRKNEIFFSKSRYILFIHMVINDMLHLILTTLIFIFSYVFYLLPVSMCTVFMLVIIFTTENTPLNLACMALECYIAICHPLHHIQVCTVKRTHVLLALIWIITFISGISDLFITLASSPIQFFYTKVVCLRLNVFPSPIVEKKRDFSYIVLLFVVWFVIVYTYFKILFSAKTASKDIKKARNTIILHGFQVLMCMTIYATPALREMLIRLFPRSSSDIQFAVYISVQILPRSLSPIVYGIKDTTFRKHMKANLMCTLGSTVKNL